MAQLSVMADGRDAILAGIEPAASSDSQTNLTAALSATHSTGHDVIGLSGNDDIARHVTAGSRHSRSTRSSPAASVRAGAVAGVGAALVAASVTEKDCAAALAAAEATARDAKLGMADSCHKQHRKSGRYFGRDWAFYAGRGQGFVRSASRGNDLSEFLAELDIGTHATILVRTIPCGLEWGRLNRAFSPSKIDGFVSWRLDRGARRATN